MQQRRVVMFCLVFFYLLAWLGSTCRLRVKNNCKSKQSSSDWSLYPVIKLFWWECSLLGCPFPYLQGIWGWWLNILIELWDSGMRCETMLASAIKTQTEKISFGRVVSILLFQKRVNTMPRCIDAVLVACASPYYLLFFPLRLLVHYVLLFLFHVAVFPVLLICLWLVLPFCLGGERLTAGIIPGSSNIKVWN